MDTAQRMQRLAEGLRSVADDIASGKLKPGGGATFDYGKPVCAFGHALSRAGWQTYSMTRNEGALCAYAPGVAEDPTYRSLAGEIANANDNGDWRSAFVHMKAMAKAIDERYGLPPVPPAVDNSFLRKVQKLVNVAPPKVKVEEPV